jgi:Uncharacterized conserved protein
MQRPIALFTDFGMAGPYLGQMKAVLAKAVPAAPVIDLMADAPAFDPRASAYLLAALVPEMPERCVVLAVVDPGVGGARRPLVAEADGRFLVGPDNGLFEPLLRRAGQARTWEIRWQPQRLSASFHGRDLFAPIAARLARGDSPEAAGCEAVEPPRLPHWPDDLAEIVYVDHYGNAMTGLRADAVPGTARLRVGEQVLACADTFSAVAPGRAFWYRNSVGLVEIAVNRGRAADALPGLSVGSAVVLERNPDAAAEQNR